MKVALVHDYLREYGGAERVLEELHQIFPHAPVYTAYYLPENLPDSFKEWNIHTSVMQSWWGIKTKYLWYTYFVPWAFEQFDLSGYDIVISSFAFGAKGVITHHNQVHIGYCHTPTRFLWGLSRSTKHGGVVDKISKYLNIFLRQWDFAAAQRVDVLVANSKTVQKRIKRFYNRDSIVIYPPIKNSGMTAVEIANLPQKFYLVVSRLERMKNLDLIIEAFNRSHKELVIVGSGTYSDYLKSIADKNIKFLGYVNDGVKNYLFNKAKGLVVSVKDEDFGMTVPEAMNMGLPVIALRSGGYQETVVENVNGLFFEESNAESLSKTIDRFEHINFDKKKIIASAEKFTSSHFSKAILDLVNSVTKKLYYET